jgi:Kef-type K+ transport system membrane component KefB
MEHLDAPQFLGLLVLVLVGAKLFGFLAKRIGQPAVLGELVAGVVLGTSVLGLIHHDNQVFLLLSEVGVVILLVEIGLETDLGQLMRVGGASTVVAVAGVILPFAGGYASGLALGFPPLVSIVLGATLTATSVGITARVLTDLGRLHDLESQVILGAAVIDDVLGLIILAVVQRLAGGQNISVLAIAQITAVAFGFLIVTLLVGSRLVPAVVGWLGRMDVPGVATTSGLVLAFGLAWLAARLGSAPIIGAFAAGLLLRKTVLAQEIERGVAQVGHFFVPIFFVVVGAAVNLRVFNPFNPANGTTLKIGALLLFVAVLGKFLAGYAAYWFPGKKQVVGAGMIPRGEVGLIFAQMGLSGGIFTEALFSAATLVVMLTTFLAPPLLKILLAPTTEGKGHAEPDGAQELVNEP